MSMAATDFMRPSSSMNMQTLPNPMDVPAKEIAFPEKNTGNFEAPMSNRRARGQLRIDALMAAAADVFARKGFEGTTMTEIAARSGSCIGSLYQFFRTKDAISEALLQKQLDALWERFNDIADRAANVATRELAEALAQTLVAFIREHPSFAALIELPARPLGAMLDVRRLMRARVEAILCLHAPSADRAMLRAMAPVVQLTMKSSIELQAGLDDQEASAASAELSELLAAYLERRLAR
jgi:AcrR family transcriptional regulator